MRERWILDEKLGKLVPEAEYRRSEPVRPGLTVIPDIAERVISPVDGSILGSRADVREHNIRNGVVDVGNDPAYKNPTKPSSQRESSSPVIAGILKGDIPIRKR